MREPLLPILGLAFAVLLFGIDSQSTPTFGSFAGLGMRGTAAAVTALTPQRVDFDMLHRCHGGPGHAPAPVWMF
jgi:hypothetical protein